MDMRAFLQALFESGHVSVAPSLRPEEQEDLTPAILEFDRVARLSLAGRAPELNLDAAGWAAERLYRICQLIVLRDLDAAQVAEVFRRTCPTPRSPETDYSADLFLQHLPQLHEFAQRLAADDPLVGHIERLANAWPLSAVGIDLLSPGEIGSFIHHPSLRQLYLDRIIERKALTLAREPHIAELIRASYGAFPELCPEIAETVTPLALA